jgi:hypothetical protein
MNWPRRIVFAGTALGSSKTASAAGAVASVGAAAGLGLELVPFVVGAVGATVVITAQPPRTRGTAWAHSVVSVFCGGIGGPWVAETGNALASHYLKTPDVNTLLTQLMCAGLLSAGWPWFGPLLWEVVRKRIKALGGKDTKGGDDAAI